MANFDRIAEKLGLEDLGEDKILKLANEETCPVCKSRLRLGQDKMDECQYSYCPKCRKKLKKVAIPRIYRGRIKAEVHND